MAALPILPALLVFTSSPAMTRLNTEVAWKFPLQGNFYQHSEAPHIQWTINVYAMFMVFSVQSTVYSCAYCFCVQVFCTELVETHKQDKLVLPVM